MLLLLMSKREDILNATRDILVEEGIHAVSFPKIFERASVGSGTVYNYFRNKEDLLNTLYREITDLLDTIVLSNFDDKQTLKDRLFMVGRNFIQFIVNYPKELAVLLACGHSPAIDEQLRNKVTPSIAKILDLIEEGITSNIFRQIDPQIAYRMFSGALLSVAQGQIDNKYILSDKLAGIVLEALWHSLSY